MKIETIEIAGFGAALTALRLPFGKQMRSVVTSQTYESKLNQSVESGCVAVINPDDLKLLQTLIKRGDEHAKVMRGIVVLASITAPIYIWSELETYRAGHERLCSESTMHIDCRGLSGDELVEAKSKIPMGKKLTKVDMFSYQCLRNMVRQRHNHRLPEWHQFVDWVRTLPFAEELIFVGLDIEDDHEKVRH